MKKSYLILSVVGAIISGGNAFIFSSDCLAEEVTRDEARRVIRSVVHKDPQIRKFSAVRERLTEGFDVEVFKDGSNRLHLEAKARVKVTVSETEKVLQGLHGDEDFYVAIVLRGVEELDEEKKKEFIRLVEQAKIEVRKLADGRVVCEKCDGKKRQALVRAVAAVGAEFLIHVDGVSIDFRVKAGILDSVGEGGKVSVKTLMVEALKVKN